jgi:hypothetical protein
MFVLAINRQTAMHIVSREARQEAVETDFGLMPHTGIIALPEVQECVVETYRLWVRGRGNVRSPGPRGKMLPVIGVGVVCIDRMSRVYSAAAPIGKIP